MGFLWMRRYSLVSGLEFEASADTDWTFQLLGVTVGPVCSEEENDNGASSSIVKSCPHVSDLSTFDF